MNLLEAIIAGKIVGDKVTPGSIVNATANMTSDQKTDTKINLGVVDCTAENVVTATSDMTAQQKTDTKSYLGVVDATAENVVSATAAMTLTQAAQTIENLGVIECTAENVVTATEDMTAEQKEATRQNIGADTPAAVTAWLNEHVDPDTGYVIDDTLTIQGAAADAKKVGDDLSRLNSTFVNNGIPFKFDYTGDSSCDFDIPIATNIPVYIRVDGGTATGVKLNFVRADTTTVNPGVVINGDETVIVPNESFVKVRIYPQPFDGTSKSVTVYIAQANYGVFSTLFDLKKQIEYPLQPAADVFVEPSNYTSYFTDANAAPINRTFIIRNTITAEMVPHLPVYNQYGFFCTICGQQTRGISLQLYAGVTGDIHLWYRTSVVSGSTSVFSNWVECSSINDVLDLLIYNQVEHGNWLKAAGGVVFEHDVSAGEHYRLYVWNVKDAIVDNPVLFLYDTGGSYVNLKAYKKEIDGTFYWDVTIPSNNPDHLRLFQTKATGAANTSCSYSLIKVSGTALDTMQTQIDNTITNVTSHATNIRTCKIFKRVVCCGDSYTSGHIQLNGENPITTNEEFAWPHFMSTLTGNEWINCGRSGATSVTWQTYDRGLPAAQAAGHVQAYVVALMINDQKTTGGVPLGVSSDIGTNNETYYAQMSKIIRELNAISPLAKIFVCTCPMTSGSFPSYNEAVRVIVETYKNTYPVHCLDLNANAELYKNTSLVDDFINGHYTAIGYEQFSEIMAYIMSDYINNHISDFQNVHQIPYTGHE